MAKATKVELVEDLLLLGVADEYDTHVTTQEFVLTALRLNDNPSDDDMVEIQNNTLLLDHMKTKEYKDNFIQVFREEYMKLDVKSLEFIIQAMNVTSKIRAVEKASNARLEEMINSLDFLVEVEEGKEETSAHKVLH